MQVKFRGRFECPECGVELGYNKDKNLYCCNEKCNSYLKEFKQPTFNIDPVDKKSEYVSKEIMNLIVLAKSDLLNDYSHDNCGINEKELYIGYAKFKNELKN